MKVLFLSSMYLRYKGDTRGLMVYELAKNLLKKGISVEVIAPHDRQCKKDEDMGGIMVRRFPYFYPRSLQKLTYGAGIPTNLRRSIMAKLQVPLFGVSFLNKAVERAGHADIIHAQWIEPGLIAVAAGKIAKKPVIVTVRRINPRGISRAVAKFVLQHADCIIFNSTFTKDECLKIAKPKRYAVIANGVDTQMFKKQSSMMRSALAIPKSNKIILFVGLLVEKKGVEYLIKAMKEIEPLHPHTALLIVGEGPESERLKSLAESLGLKNSIRFLGQVDPETLAKIYGIADIFVLPSIKDSGGETETLGVVLLEAMASELPVIASDVGGIPDIVDRNVGSLVPQKDPHALAKTLIRLLDSPRLAAKMGKAGRKKAMEHFSSRKQAEKTIKLYREVLS
ncbi:glycosyltransferase [Candidatus Woesearchaeota archaeon]|nr:glycosyltransferase [Candidatus Woesearchaeota archaeon]